MKTFETIFTIIFYISFIINVIVLALTLEGYQVILMFANMGICYGIGTAQYKNEYITKK